MATDHEQTQSSHLSDLGLMHNRVVTLVEMNQRLADERDRLREHIAITIETLTRGDEFPMLPDGGNPLQSCIDRLKGAL